ncbi:hypothetical protein, partial [Mycolicibacterium porcinum]|uniref:hypothetical protein n=1 Tax=Mycolicibacterium porcinum TaxID=39693 RepID=UPI0010427B3C
MKWNAWGDPQAAKPLSDGIRSLLQQALGVEAASAAEPTPDQVQLRPSVLSGPPPAGVPPRGGPRAGG